MKNLMEKMNNNPVYIKEIKVRERLNSRQKLKLPSWSGYLAILILPLLITILMNSFKQRLSIKDLQSVFMISIFLQVLYYIYRGASHAWGLITGEKEMKTYGNLISTGMSPEEIVQGKFWASFFPLAKELTFLSPVFVIICLLLQIQLFFLIQVYLLTLLFTAFFSMVGIYFSAREKTSTEARNNTVRTIVVLLVGIYVAGSILTFISAMLFSSIGIHHYSPLYMIPMMLLSAISPFTSLWAGSILINSPQLDNNTILIYSGYIIFTFFIYIVTTRVLYKKTVKRMGEIPG